MKTTKIYIVIFIIFFVVNNLYSQTKTDKFFNKGVKNYEKEKYTKAIKAFDKAILFSPEEGKLYCERGRAFAEIGDTISAINDFDKSIELDDSYDNGNAYFCKAEIQFHFNNEYDSALYYYEKAMLFENSRAYNNSGSIVNEQGDKEKAILYFSKAIEINPFYTTAYYNRGAVLEKQNKYIEAITDL